MVSLELHEHVSFLQQAAGTEPGVTAGPETPMDFFEVALIFEKKTSIFPKVKLNAPGPSKYVSSSSVQFFYAPGHI